MAQEPQDWHGAKEGPKRDNGTAVDDLTQGDCSVLLCTGKARGEAHRAASPITAVP